MPGLDVLVWIARADQDLDEADHDATFGFIAERLAVPTARVTGLA